MLALGGSLAAAGSDEDNSPADRGLGLDRAIVDTLGRRRTVLPGLPLDTDQTLGASLHRALQKWGALEPASLARSPEIVDSTGCC